MNFWKFAFAAALRSAALTSVPALEAGADWKSVGVSAGAGALVGLLQALVNHPATTATATKAVAIAQPNP